MPPEADDEEESTQLQVAPHLNLTPQAKFWEARPKAGRTPIYTDPAKLLADCVEYFEWCNNNPLKEIKIVVTGKVVERVPIFKMRAMTVNGLTLFLCMDRLTWSRMAGRAPKSAFQESTTHQTYSPEIRAACIWVEQAIYEQKFSGAAADLLNVSIIMRELGLVDKKEFSGPEGKPLQVITTTMTPLEAAEIWLDVIKSEDLDETPLIEDQSDKSD